MVNNEFRNRITLNFHKLSIIHPFWENRKSKVYLPFRGGDEEKFNDKLKGTHVTFIPCLFARELESFQTIHFLFSSVHEGLRHIGGQLHFLYALLLDFFISLPSSCSGHPVDGRKRSTNIKLFKASFPLGYVSMHHITLRITYLTVTFFSFC